MLLMDSLERPDADALLPLRAATRHAHTCRRAGQTERWEQQLHIQLSVGFSVTSILHFHTWFLTGIRKDAVSLVLRMTVKIELIKQFCKHYHNTLFYYFYMELILIFNHK